MFGRKIIKKTYDTENLVPALKCSICTGEQVAGFQNIHTCQFEDVMLIRNEKELKKFMEMYDIESMKKIY